MTAGASLPSDKTLIEFISTHKYFVALAAIFVVLGSKELIIEMSASSRPIFTNPLVKKITLFFIFFLYSRDIFVAGIMSGIVILLFPKVFFSNSYCKESNKTESSLY